MPGDVAPPRRTIAAQFVNPADASTAINFVVDGVAYSVPDGFTQKVIATASSVVQFDRGDLFGDARYSLSDGPYEFRSTDRGWGLYKMPIGNPVPINTTSGGGLPRNAPPVATGFSPFNDGPSATREVVPPPPTPSTTGPR